MTGAGAQMDGDNAQSQGAVPSEATQSSEGQQQPQQPFDGFQKRIDELTAARREAERQVQEIQQRLASRDEQLMGLVQQLAQRQYEPPPQTQQPHIPDVPPELRTFVDAYALNPIQSRLDKLEKLLTQTSQVSGMQMEMLQLEQMANTQRTPPEVVQDAKARLAAWRRQGLGANVAGADAALQMAWGAHAQRALNQPQVPTQQPPPQPTGGAHSFPPPADAGGGGSGGQAPRLPPNFDRLTNDQQLAWFEKNGYGDKPLW